LHCSDGPAFEWLDGISEFYLDGVLVSPLVVQSPEWITVETIGMERNSESRRVMIERYRPGEQVGAAAFARDVQARRDDLMARYRAACNLLRPSTATKSKAQFGVGQTARAFRDRSPSALPKPGNMRSMPRRRPGTRRSAIDDELSQA
jgi:hypothetical protein